jgi:hypothetical protein
MARSWLLSSLLHAVLAGLLYFGLPSLTRPPPAMEQAVTVELVTEVPETERQPPAPEVATTAPAPEREAAAPEPNPTPPTPTPEPQPGPPPPAPVLAEPEPPPQPEPPRPAPPQPEPAPPPQPEPPQPEVALAEPDAAPEPPRPPEPVVQPKPAPAPVTEPASSAPQVPPPEMAQHTPQPPPPTPPTPKPTLKPEPPKTVAEQEPRPKPGPEPQPQAKPEPPKPEPPKEDAFAALLKSVEQMDRRVESEDVQTGRGRSAAAEGQARTTIGEAALSFSEVDALRRQIGGCWTLPVGVEGIQDMVVQLRIEVRPDRTVQRVTIGDQSRLDRDPSFRAVAESARRAVDRCSPLNLPPGKYSVWRDIMMNFYPQDAISG